MASRDGRKAWRGQAGRCADSSARPAAKGPHRAPTKPTQTERGVFRRRTDTHEEIRLRSRRTICSRGGEAVTGVGGASVGPVDPRIHCGPRFRAHRHHLVVGLAARRRGQHAPLPRDERRRWGLSDASPSCGAEICSRATATVRRGTAPRHPPSGSERLFWPLVEPRYAAEQTMTGWTRRGNKTALSFELFRP